jgi:hypothetical protein
MTEDDPTFSMDVKIQRGNGTDDRDTLKATVQPDDTTVDRLTEDQTTLEEQEVES